MDCNIVDVLAIRGEREGLDVWKYNNHVFGNVLRVNFISGANCDSLQLG